MKPNDKQPVLTGPILTKWVPHEENNVENPRATLMRFGKWQGQKLEEVDKNYLRTFKKYRTNSSERETAEVFVFHFSELRKYSADMNSLEQVAAAIVTLSSASQSQGNGS